MSKRKIQTVRPYRLLPLDGEDSTVLCRVWDPITYGTLIRKSNANTKECASRTVLRMNNLIACRGHSFDESMIGPGDYYTNLEKPHQKAFSINIRQGIPSFSEHPLSDVSSEAPKTPLQPEQAIEISVNWVSGKSKDIEVVKQQYASTGMGDSLFPDSGILECKVQSPSLTLPSIDATRIDLSPFNVRLVNNQQPFQLTDTPLNPKDEYRPVSYHFGDRYAERVVNSGGGLFLEVHEFTQTMTPLDSQAGGFITLGRWLDSEKTRLQLIAVHIPFGYTLIVDKGAIHGDTTFKGSYMMAMTSNHTTMQTADTVFLKHPGTGGNISLHSQAPERSSQVSVEAPKPLYIPNSPTKEDLLRFRKSIDRLKSSGVNLIMPLYNWTMLRLMILKNLPEPILQRYFNDSLQFNIPPFELLYGMMKTAGIVCIALSLILMGLTFIPAAAPGLLLGGLVSLVIGILTIGTASALKNNSFFSTKVNEGMEPSNRFRMSEGKLYP